MRLFEMALLVLATALPFLLYFRFLKMKKQPVIAAVLAILAIHLLFEGFRWQMVPAYAMVLVVVFLAYQELTYLKLGKFPTVLAVAAAVLLLVPGWIFPIILPVFSLPTPGGRYSVGSRSLQVTTDRPEIITEQPDDNRSFMVKVWYPSTHETGTKEPYLDEGNRLGFTNKYGLPGAALGYLDLVETHTYQNAAIADGTFPVLIFSHGSYSEAYGYYALLEEIVSQGYVVFNINHTYESSGAVFPDGEVKLYHAAYDQKTNNAAMAEMTWNAIQNFNGAETEEERLLAVEDLIRNYIAANTTERWALDFSNLIDQLEPWNESSFLSNHLELSKIGAFGHSQGGSAVGQALLDDQRIVAGLNLDGMQWGQMIDTTFTQPFALVSSEWDDAHPKLNKYAYRHLSPSNFQDIIVRNTGHSNFMDIPLRINLPLINEAGSIDPYRGFEVISAIVLAFFDAHLKHQDTSIETVAKKYGEIVIKP